MNKIILVVTLFLIFAVVIGIARAEEPNWDKIVPIVIQIESSGNPYAVSEDGCIGLMQISRAVFIEFCEKENDDYYTSDLESYDFILFNPDRNKEIGTWYLKRIWNHYLLHYKLEQNIENLLIAYNFGIGNLVKYRKGKVKLPAETRNYLLRYYKLAKVKR